MNGTATITKDRVVLNASLDPMALLLLLSSEFL
jgi:hypothetical protein